jgi:hypothetical protein
MTKLLSLVFLAAAGVAPAVAQVGLGRVSGGFQIADGPQRSAAMADVYNETDTLFDPGAGYLEWLTTFEEIITVSSDVFFQVGNNNVVLDAIKEVRCGAQVGSCSIASVVVGGDGSRVGFNISGSLVGDTVEALGTAPGAAGFDDAVLVAINNTLQDPNFNISASSVAAASVSGQAIFQVDLWRNASSDPTAPTDLAQADALKALFDSTVTSVLVARGTVGDGALTSSLDYCALRTCGQCDAVTGLCTACPTDTWGLNCEIPCVCQNGGTCGPTACRCDYPYMGLRCDTVKDCNCST